MTVEGNAVALLAALVPPAHSCARESALVRSDACHHADEPDGSEVFSPASERLVVSVVDRQLSEDFDSL